MLSSSKHGGCWQGCPEQLIARWVLRCFKDVAGHIAQSNTGEQVVLLPFDDATGGAPSLRNPRLLFGSALEGDGSDDESSEDESGSRLERAKNFGSGVLSSIEKRVRREAGRNGPRGLGVHDEYVFGKQRYSPE